jgi:predicted GNAT superfamily acetyltransferase
MRLEPLPARGLDRGAPGSAGDACRLHAPAVSDLPIRLLHTPGEMVAVEALQAAVWPGDPAAVVPGHLLVTAAHNGGLVAGAFDGDDLAGFVFGFPGFARVGGCRSVKHCSHMLGVDPARRGAGIGFALKRFQWQFVRAQGLRLVTWTYDPLLAPNAALNIGRLGATCRIYLPDAYGTMNDGLNAGLPSDRFQVDWWVNTARVARRMAAAPGDEVARRAGVLRLAGRTPSLNLDPAGLPDPPQLPAALPAGRLLLHIPPDFNQMRAADPAHAGRWRGATRAAFTRLFAAGFTVVEFVPGPAPAYLLARRAPARIARLKGDADAH